MILSESRSRLFGIMRRLTLTPDLLHHRPVQATSRRKNPSHERL